MAEGNKLNMFLLFILFASAASIGALSYFIGKEEYMTDRYNQFQGSLQGLAMISLIVLMVLFVRGIDC
ncbi:MAG TPA: hypothetical protein V6C58_02410 [Allocoleopsis sp.]